MRQCVVAVWCATRESDRESYERSSDWIVECCCGVRLSESERARERERKRQGKEKCNVGERVSGG